MSFLISKWPTRSQWGQVFKVLTKKEKYFFFVFLLLAITSFIFLSVDLYLKNTEIRPAKGGTYTEGVVGSPRFINPVYSPAYDVDRDLTELIYSGLMKYDEEGKIIPDLVQEYNVLENGKVFEFYLKENLLWQDAEPLTADDVIFTIKTIENPSLKSPIRADWIGVKAEKISDLGVRFELKNPSAVFLENCTLKIIPKHIWEEISDQNFPLSIYNLKPIGSGPYKIKDLTQDKEGNIKSLELVNNGNYYGDQPNIPSVIFLFFNDEAELTSAFKNNQIQGFKLSSPEKYQILKRDDFIDYHLLIPRYFAVFFNPTKSKSLADAKVRIALNYGTDKEEIVNEVLLKQGKVVDSPILPNIFGFETPEKVYEFNQEKANQLLDEAGYVKKENGFREKTVNKEPAFQFKSNLQVGSQGAEVQELQKCLAKDSEVYPDGEITGYFGSKTKEAVIKFQEKYKSEILTPSGLTSGTGSVLKSTRDKLNQLCAAPSAETLSLSFSLITVNQPNLKKVANLLKEQWKALGVNVEINTFEVSALEQEIIKPRNYEMLLFGEALEAVPDPFPFWHSSQVKDPGLNLSSYENKECDKLLEEERQTQDQEKRKTSLEKFQNLLIEDAPAVFLYSPDFLYLVSKDIKGIDAKIITDPSQRFSNIEGWYIKTKRAWK
ncbi:MAG: ABC transporter substrate-binding protein [Candidatus Pacebacteria bacterium]|nr:ABC transporter substrate-binding protein [Candidatus Paceibacterota bacterium]